LFLQERLLTAREEKEVDIRDTIEDKVCEYYENQKEQAEQQAEVHKKQKLYQKELELYGEQGKELYEYYTNQQIDALQAVIDKKEEEREAQNELNEKEELQNNLIEARIKLQEALNNKTTKILKKQADGTWQYEYSANMVDVKAAQEEVEEAEKALDDYNYEQEIEALRDKIDEIKGSMDNLAEQYENAEFWADREYEQTMNNIAQTFGDVDGLVEKWMKTYGGNPESLSNAYIKLTNSNITLEDSIVKLTELLESKYETVGKSKDITAKNGVTSFDTGGLAQGSGLAFVHDKERILTASQNIYFEQLISKLPELLKLIDVTKVNGGMSGYAANFKDNADKTLSTIINKVECIFPNITTTEGLQKAILELPRLALQQK
jgi:chromosome segregation ATPase